MGRFGPALPATLRTVVLKCRIVISVDQEQASFKWVGYGPTHLYLVRFVGDGFAVMGLPKTARGKSSTTAFPPQPKGVGRSK